MIKLTFCLRRLPHLTREEFQRYWREQHAPLVARHAGTLGILRYVQTHTGHDTLNSAMQGSRGGPDAYDGVAELWFESEDERKFIDLANSPLWFGDPFDVVS